MSYCQGCADRERERDEAVARVQELEAGIREVVRRAVRDGIDEANSVGWRAAMNTVSEDLNLLIVERQVKS